MFFDTILDYKDDIQGLDRLLSGLDDMIMTFLSEETLRSVLVPDLRGVLLEAYQPNRSRINALRLAVRSPEFVPPRLLEHGLTGQELRAKLTIVKYYDDRLSAALRPNTRLDDLGLLTNILKKLVAAIDVPLESLVAAIGAGGAIVEFKKIFGLAIDEQD